MVGMNKQINLQTEPAAIIAGIVTVIEAAIALLPLFGVPLTTEQLAGIMALVVALGGVVGAIWTRSIVYAPSTVEKLQKENAYK